MDVVIKGEEKLSAREVAAYIDYLKEKRPNTSFGTVSIECVGKYVNITYEVLPDNLLRVRRIKDFEK